MLISLTSIMLAFFIGLFWLSHMRAREIALSLAKKLCEEAHTQMLDDSISLCRTKLSRQENGWLCFKREYQFEYSEDGQIRRRGRVILLGHQKQLARLDHIQNQSPMCSIQENSPAEIIKFDQVKLKKLTMTNKSANKSAHKAEPKNN